MTTDELTRINTHHLRGWRSLLAREHATALFLLGIGEDHVRGKRVICGVEDVISKATLAALLRSVADDLDPGSATVQVTVPLYVLRG